MDASVTDVAKRGARGRVGPMPGRGRSSLSQAVALLEGPYQVPVPQSIQLLNNPTDALVTKSYYNNRELVAKEKKSKHHTWKKMKAAGKKVGKGLERLIDTSAKGAANVSKVLAPILDGAAMIDPLLMPLAVGNHAVGNVGGLINTTMKGIKADGSGNNNAANEAFTQRDNHLKILNALTNDQAVADAYGRQANLNARGPNRIEAVDVD